MNIALGTLEGSSTQGLTEAHPITTASHLKTKIIDAYAEIHARGILHGSPYLRNILLTDDDQVHLIDWQHARSLNPISDVKLPRCSHAQLDWEMRTVKYLLDADNARRKEWTLWKESDKTKSVSLRLLQV